MPFQKQNITWYHINFRARENQAEQLICYKMYHNNEYL